MSLFERGTAAAAPGDPWLDDIGRAKVQSLLQQKDYSRLEVEIQGFLARFPDSSLAPAVLRMQARAQLEQNHYGEAEATLRRLDDVGAEKKASDLFLLGMAHEGQRRFAAAIEPLEAYLETADQASRRQALALLAVCCARCGRFDDARAATTRRCRAERVGSRERREPAGRFGRTGCRGRASRRASSKPRRRSASGCSTKSQIRAERGRALVGLPGAAFHASDYAEADKALSAALNLPLQEKLAFEGQAAPRQNTREDRQPGIRLGNIARGRSRRAPVPLLARGVVVRCPGGRTPRSAGVGDRDVRTDRRGRAGGSYRGRALQPGVAAPRTRRGAASRRAVPPALPGPSREPYWAHAGRCRGSGPSRKRSLRRCGGR
jgi:tetratricopeptide (TPR) repeat protein